MPGGFALRVGMLRRLPHLLHLLLLLTLNLLPLPVAAERLTEESSCPVAGPFSAAGTCVVCQTKSACIRETGRFDANCFKGVVFSSSTQVKAYRCNFEVPPEFADALQPGAFIQCNTSSALSTSQAASASGSRLGGSCIFGLVAAGDPIVCKATRCIPKTNSTVLQCQANSCDCSGPSGCTGEFATNLVERLSGPISWGCEVPSGGLTSLSNPADCTWKAAGLPGGSAQAICDVGECDLPEGRYPGEQEAAEPGQFKDMDALMEFKRSFTNGEEVLAEWSPNGNPCDWDGVVCYFFDAVQQLLLYDRGLKGKLPPSETLPSSMTFLDLNGNSLSGSIPADWKLPPNLRQLKLARNRLTGSIPPTWSLPVNLTDLDLAFNQLNGSLSTAWQLPATMVLFSAYGNQLSGSIPPGWVLPRYLQRLSLGGNKLSGEAVPEGLVLPETLRWYEVDVNQLGGNFVEMAARMPPRLEYVGLNNNSITGTLPPEWNLPITVLKLSLSSNLMTGSIPSTWEPPPSLYDLYLFNNRFTGTLPSWPELTDLNATVAPNPGLCGTVPSAPIYNAWDPYISSGFEKNFTNFGYSVVLMDYIDNINVTTPLRRLPDCSPVNGSVPSSSATENGSASSDNSGGGRSNVGAIAGGVGGGCMVLVVACGIVLWQRARRRALKQSDIEKVPTEDGIEEPAQSDRRAVGADRASAPQLGGSGMAGGGEAMMAPLGRTHPGWDASDLQHKIASLSTQPMPFQNVSPVLAGQNQVVQLGTPSLVSSGGARGSTQPSSISSSVASKGFLASDTLISSIVMQLKTGAGRHPGVSSSSGGAGTGPSHGSRTLGLAGTGEPLGMERRDPQAQGLVPGMQHRRSTGTGSSSTSQRQLVDVRLWHVEFMDLHLIRQIGSGSFGRVYLAAWQETLVAVKLLLGEAAAIGNTDEAAKAVLSVSDPLLDNLKQEASLMAALRHPYVLGEASSAALGKISMFPRFMGLCTASPSLISEYCPRGSLYDTLRSARQFTTRALELTWSIRLQMVTGAAIGMYYLHHFKPAIIHRDLKSNNLLIDENWNTKVADFNLSKIMELGGAEGTSVASSHAGVGNPRWLAPEVLGGEPHTFASDCFSFGMIMWEVLTWEVPWASVNFWQVTANVQEGLRPSIPKPEDLPGAEKVFAGLDRYIALLNRCWSQKPADRPPLAAIVSELW